MSILKPSYRQGYAKGSHEAVHPNLWRGLIGMWSSRLGPTGTTLFDLSGYKQHGSFVSMEADTDWIISGNPKLPGYTLDFDTGTEHVDIGASDPYEGMSAITVSIWANRHAQVPSGRVLLGKYWDGSNRSWVFYERLSDKISFLLATDTNNTNTVADCATEFPDDDSWHHIVGTWSSWDATIRIYFDGVEDGTQAQTGNTVRANTEDLHFGESNGLSNGWYGGIGEVCIYDRVLSQREIKQLFNGDSPLDRRLRSSKVHPIVWSGGAETPHLTVLNYRQGFARGPADSAYPKLWRGLLAMYSPMLGPSGTTLFDHGLRKQHGTLQNMDPGTDYVIDHLKAGTTMVNGYCLDFDGSNDYVDLPTGFPNLTGELTITLWFLTRTVAAQTFGTGLVLDANSGANLAQFGLEVNRTAARLNAIQSYQFPVPLTSNTDLSANTWYHAAMTRKGLTGDWTFELFLDGVTDGSATTSNDPDAHQGTAIGRQGQWDNTSGGYLNGLIHDVRIYNRVLSDSEVWESYQGASPLTPKTFTYKPIAAAGVASNLMRIERRVLRGVGRGFVRGAS